MPRLAGTLTGPSKPARTLQRGCKSHRSPELKDRRASCLAMRRCLRDLLASIRSQADSFVAERPNPRPSTLKAHCSCRGETAGDDDRNGRAATDKSRSDQSRRCSIMNSAG